MTGKTCETQNTLLHIKKIGGKITDFGEILMWQRGRKEAGEQ